MRAYEFYFRDKSDGVHLIGILPERRKNPERINSESIMNWIKKLLGESADFNNIFIVEVGINKTTGEVVESTLHRTQKDR